MPEFWASDGSHTWPFSSGLKAAIERSVIVNPWVIITQEVCVQPKIPLSETGVWGLAGCRTHYWN